MQHPLRQQHVNSYLGKAVRQIEQRRKQEYLHFYSSGMHHKIKDEFIALSKTVAALNAEGKPEFVVSKALYNRYDSSQSAMQKAFLTNLDEDFHDFRKDTKNLMYQLTIIRNVWPEYFLALILELDKLQSYLGDYHDLFILNEQINSGEVMKMNPLEKKAIYQLTNRKRKNLRKRIQNSGSFFFNEEAVSFATRLMHIWKYKQS